MTSPAFDRPARLGVFASGGGSNLQALFDYFDGAGLSLAEIAWVGSDRMMSGALDRARARDVPAETIDHANGAAILDRLATYRVEIIVLAGYLRFLPDEVTAAFRGRAVNVHPALLPAFGGHGMYGMRVHASVLAAGAKVSGATVHFVDAAYDRGSIITQWPVPVLPQDTPDTLGRRVLAVEHLLLPRVVAALAAGHVRLAPDNRVITDATGAHADQPFALPGMLPAVSMDLLLPVAP